MVSHGQLLQFDCWTVDKNIIIFNQGMNDEKQWSLKTLVLFFQNFINDENRKKYSQNQFLEDR